MEQWLGDLYEVQGMDSLSGLISKRIGICNIGVCARGGAVGAIPWRLHMKFGFNRPSGF